ncbi:FAD-dependent oxidoreductase [Microbacterium sp. KSW4-17]|uniref:FAD-dependent oxidoreductase n=1 Tax=Microbacterium galbum TaxID=3075994 RepID=A0ABU3T5V2_9MICO|nr:FAD-dependent oxidoreductase [Microbacterium sp. KSW4-17]MDU0366690.1 FAD-dependent oxidoreductase [Microbacterium sp. KSW4-17]
MTSVSRRRARPLTAVEAGRAEWDLVVVGAGSAGLVGARTAAVLGARVLLVEANGFGGECLFTGCVPSKALIAAADAAHDARVAARMGIHVDGVRVDFAAVMAHVKGAIAAIEPVDSPETLAETGVYTLRGRARFDGPRSLVVEGVGIRFRDALVATGNTPIVPEGVDVLTNETLWDLDELPANLLVLGGGAIGCEMAQAFVRLGSRVTLVHRGDRLLPKEDPAASALVLSALRADGVDVRLGMTLAEASRGVGGTTARLADGTTVVVDRVLAALGRRVDTTGLGVEAAGVDLDRAGAIAVDRTLATSNPRIRAAGDATPLPRFTHTAGMFGSIAATNAVLGLSRRVRLDDVPRVTFTSPEVAAVGTSTVDTADSDVRIVETAHHDLDRAIAEGRTAGFTRLAVDRKGRVVGATIVGPRAGESLGELSTAVSRGLSVRDLAGVLHAYPTYSDAGWNAAVRDAQGALRTGAVAAVIRLLRRVRRRRG